MPGCGGGHRPLGGASLWACAGHWEGQKNSRRWRCWTGVRRSPVRCQRWPSWGWSPEGGPRRCPLAPHQSPPRRAPVWGAGSDSSTRPPRSPGGRRPRTPSPRSGKAHRWGLQRERRRNRVRGTETHASKCISVVIGFASFTQGWEFTDQMNLKP